MTTMQWGWIGGSAMPDAPKDLRQGWIATAFDGQGNQVARGYGTTRAEAKQDLKQKTKK